MEHLYFTTQRFFFFFFLSPAFLFLSQPQRNVNRCWLRFQSARRVMGQKNNWREHLFFYQAGKLDPNPKSHLRVKDKAPLSAAFSFVAAEDQHRKFSSSFSGPYVLFDGGGGGVSEWRWRLQWQVSLHTFLAASQRHRVVANHKPNPGANIKHNTGANRRAFLSIPHCIVPI